MDRFITLNGIQFTRDQLLPITGYNPYLLSLAIRKKTPSDLITVVDRNLHLFITRNLKISNTLPEDFVRLLKRSEEYFWMVSNDHTLQNDAAVVEFNSSWVAKHKICYLQGIAVRINFPRLPEILKADVRALVRDNRIDISAFPQVQGYVVEEIFFDYAKENNIAVLNNSFSCTFQVNQVQQLGLNEANLSLDVLYRLRMYHPVIDAVGVFSQGDNAADLVYFQVSISSYDGCKTQDLVCWTLSDYECWTLSDYGCWTLSDYECWTLSNY